MRSPIPKAVFLADVDPTYERSPFNEVTVMPKDELGNVQILLETSDGFHWLYASPARWESIIAAIRVSLEEEKP